MFKQTDNSNPGLSCEVTMQKNIYRKHNFSEKH